MKTTAYWWLARFAKVSLVMGLAVALLALFAKGILPSLLRLASHGVWQWEPLNTWVRSALLGGLVGPLFGCYTLIEWWQATRASKLLKIIVAITVVVVSYGVMVFLKPRIWGAFPN